MTPKEPKYKVGSIVMYGGENGTLCAIEAITVTDSVVKYDIKPIETWCDIAEDKLIFIQ